jgi:hypothetical protein
MRESANRRRNTSVELTDRFRAVCYDSKGSAIQW